MCVPDLDLDLRDFAVECRQNYGEENWLDPFISFILDYIVEPLKDQLNDFNWYKMWHNRFRQEIDFLTRELETYRPTVLHGNGQCKCSNCGTVNWTDFGFSRYKGQILCDLCLDKVLKKELASKVSDDINTKRGD